MLNTVMRLVLSVSMLIRARVRIRHTRGRHVRLMCASCAGAWRARIRHTRGRVSRDRARGKHVFLRSGRVLVDFWSIRFVALAGVVELLRPGRFFWSRFWSLNFSTLTGAVGEKRPNQTYLQKSTTIREVLQWVFLVVPFSRKCCTTVYVFPNFLVVWSISFCRPYETYKVVRPEQRPARTESGRFSLTHWQSTYYLVEFWSILRKW